MILYTGKTYMLTYGTKHKRLGLGYGQILTILTPYRFIGCISGLSESTYFIINVCVLSDDDANDAHENDTVYNADTMKYFVEKTEGI